MRRAVLGARLRLIAGAARPVGLALALAVKARTVHARLEAGPQVAGLASPALVALALVRLVVALAIAGAVEWAAARRARGAREEGSTLAHAAPVAQWGRGVIGVPRRWGRHGALAARGVVAVVGAVLGRAVAAEEARVALAHSRLKAHAVAVAVVGAAQRLAEGAGELDRVETLALAGGLVAKPAAGAAVRALGLLACAAHPAGLALARGAAAEPAAVAIVDARRGGDGDLHALARGACEARVAGALRRVGRNVAHAVAAAVVGAAAVGAVVARPAGLAHALAVDARAMEVAGGWADAGRAVAAAPAVVAEALAVLCAHAVVGAARRAGLTVELGLLVGVDLYELGGCGRGRGGAGARGGPGAGGGRRQR